MKTAIYGDRQTTTGTRLTCLDQLLLAKEQLEKNDSSNGRLAHILTDNAIELMLHHQADHAVTEKYFYPEIQNQSDKDRSDYIGRKLKPKVRLAKAIGVVNEAEASFILVNHEYRNEVYHTGVRHENIIWDLAWHYHTFACSLLPRIKLGLGESFRMNVPVPPRLSGFISQESDLCRGDFSSNLKRLCEIVQNKSVRPAERLGSLLANAIAGDVKVLDEALSFIEKRSGKSKSKDDIIVEAQLWSAMFDEERRNRCKRTSCTKSVVQLQAEGITDPIDIWRALLQPAITSNPIQKWNHRVSSVKAETDVMMSVKKYHTLWNEIADLYEDVLRSAAALEAHLDYLRGK